jgi:adenine-specific DNA-methyltransferase
LAKSGESTYARKSGSGAGKVAERYTHPDQTTPMRPDVGTQAQFRKKKPPKTYRYDSSLSPALEWDGQNRARETGEWLIAQIERASRLEPPHQFDSPQTLTSADGTVLLTVCGLLDAVDQLKALSKPFLNWAGKAERLSFDVPTLPLFVHERLSTKAIVDTLVGHKKDTQAGMWDLFGDAQHSVTDQVLKAYEYPDKWTNRLILGDSLVVMNSLLQYEGLGGQVQMIYIDPPYGVKFGSNFQPFVRKRDVSHNDDEDLTREPEMVKAYRDTWELGLHSYLTYMRDRLLLARDLLTPSGSVFVQISDENLHHVRELMDEVFGAENFVNQVTFVRGGSQTEGTGLPSNCDFLLWFAKDAHRLKRRPVLVPDGGWAARALDLWEEAPDGTRRRVSSVKEVAEGARAFTHRALESARTTGSQLNKFEIEFEGRRFSPKRGWSTTPDGIDELKKQRRLMNRGEGLRFITFLDDFPYSILTANWTDTGTGSFTETKSYAVQTSVKVLQRCILMTTEPGDLVLDPTCGSGTAAYVAEQWGRRWITIDTSRVPLALARQRLLTATYPYYQLKDPKRGPSGGFVYVRKQNRKGEEIGGIVPHITLKSIANNEPPEEEVLADRPEVDNSFVRVTGPFAVEATIPTPVDWEGDGVEDSGSEQAQEYGSFVERMIEVLRRSPVLHVGGGKTVQLWNVRPPARSLSLSAEAIVKDIDDKPVAFVFGPESGAISEKLVHAALKEADLKSYTALYVIGFAIQPHARDLIEKAADVGFMPATYVQATPDLMMGDLLKNMRSSQIFSVCGLPDVDVRQVKGASAAPKWEVELRGLNTFDPMTMEVDDQPGSNVPAWLLDTDYNDLCFHVSQAFFPRTGAWNDLRKSLKGDYDESVWDHLAGTTSAPFEAGEHRQIAVKVIDDRGNELMVVKKLG